MDIYITVKLCVIGLIACNMLRMAIKNINSKRRAKTAKTMALRLFPYAYDRQHRPTIADERAAQLLWDHLSDEQRKEALEEQKITIKKGGATLTIFTTNVYGTALRRPNHKYQRSVCINLLGGERLPHGDILLAKKLAFEADPDGFSSTARG